MTQLAFDHGFVAKVFPFLPGNPHLGPRSGVSRCWKHVEWMVGWHCWRAVYVTIAIHMGRECVVPSDQGRVDSIRVAGGVPPSTNSDPNWSQLNSVNLEDVFELRVPVESCRHFFRGRLRESFNLVLRERFRARLKGKRPGVETLWPHPCHVVAQICRDRFSSKN